MPSNKPGGDFPGACPLCGCRLVGRIGSGQYFCWECCSQFSGSGPRLRVWAIDDEGGLVPRELVSAETSPGAGQTADGEAMRGRAGTRTSIGGDGK